MYCVSRSAWYCSASGTAVVVCCGFPGREGLFLVCFCFLCFVFCVFFFVIRFCVFLVFFCLFLFLCSFSFFN